MPSRAHKHSTETVRVGAVQMISRNGDTPANIVKAMAFCDRAAKRGVQILCLPELASTGFDWLKNDRMARRLHSEPVPGPMVTQFEQKAAETDMYIIMGVVERSRRSRKRFNTAFIVGPTEGYIGKYRKIFAERMFEPGTDVPVFETRHARVGIYICADKRCPEISRLLNFRGASILFQPTNYYCRKKGTTQPEARRTYEGKVAAQRSRSMENALPLVVANAGRKEYVNNSCILAPTSQGPQRFLGRATRKEQLLVADVEIQRNRSFPASYVRRVGWLYEELAVEAQKVRRAMA